MSTNTEATAAAQRNAFRDAHPLAKRVAFAVAAVLVGVVVAGFWNYHAVDGLGRTVFAEPLVGNTGDAAGAYGSLGSAFGLLFAVAAGLAATFTACNCVVFAMLPGLATRSGEGVDRAVLVENLGAFVGGVVVVGVGYGTFVGMLGPEGIEAMNATAVRLAQAQAVVTLLGVALLAWGAAEMGFLSPVVDRLSPETRAFLAQPTTRGRDGSLRRILRRRASLPRLPRPADLRRDSPLPALRDRGHGGQRPGHDRRHGRPPGAHGQIPGRSTRQVGPARPHGPRMLTGFALLTGGAYFVFYWGLAFAFGVGRWGFKLGWYA